MTSINSSNNKFLPMLKNAFRRNIAHYIITQVIMLLITLSSLRSLLSLKPYGVTDITDDYSTAIAGFFSGLFLLEGFILAVSMFKEIYSKRASDFYFSMPVKRGTYYNTNMLFGLLNMATAYIISFVLSIIVIKTDIIYPSKFYIFDVGYFAQHLLVSFLAVAAIFAVFMLCAVVSGKKWHYVLMSYISVFLVFLGIIELIGYINTIWGLWIDISKAWIISPMGVLFADVGMIQYHTVKLCVAAIIQFCIAYAAGYIVFKKRKAEVAEYTLSGRIMPAIMIICCLVTEFFICLNVVDVSLTKRIISGIIVAAITIVVITAICYRKAITKATLKCLGGAAVITAVVIACVEFIPNADYIKYVPEASEVESVTIYNNVDYSNPNIIDLLYGISFYSSYYDDYSDDSSYTYTFSSDEAKEKMYNFHKKLVADETQKNAYGEAYYTYGYNSLKIKYNLKNGKTVTRSYCVGANDVYQEYAALMQTEEGINQLVSINSEDVLFAYAFNDYYYVYDEYEDETDNAFSEYLTLDEYNTIINKIKSDRKNESPATFLESTDSGFTMWELEGSEYLFSVAFYSFSENVTAEEKEKLSQMTPEEIVNYENMIMVNSDYDAPDILDAQDYIISSSDKEVCEYLKELGYDLNSVA